MVDQYRIGELKRMEKILSKLTSRKKIGIYGTGIGAKIILEALSKIGLINNVVCFIDNDVAAEACKSFLKYKVIGISKINDDIDVIIVSTRSAHEIVFENIKKIVDDNRFKVDIFNVYGEDYNSVNDKMEYIEFLEKSYLTNTDEFVPIDEKNIYKAESGDTKIIAWYLPQFYEMEVNNKYHGQGFTEWTNTSKSRPVYTGHYQPHIPYDVGYYNLLNIETIKRQIYLAKIYGIYGFCYHYYWFSGNRIMEKPLDELLEHKELDIHFCLNWATENWSALWQGDGGENIFIQDLKEDDDEKFMRDIIPYMQDERYITIDGKPVLSIYRCDIFNKERFKRLIRNFRDIAKRNGFSDLYILITTASQLEEDVEEWGGDGLVEFPSWQMPQYMENIKLDCYINPKFGGVIWDADTFCKKRKYMMKHPSKNVFRSALLSYDNTPRRFNYGAAIFYGLNPNTYKQWLFDILVESKTKGITQDFVFVNSWNEWAEGQHLEPDLKYGYSYLQATKEALLEARTYDKLQN